MYRIVKILILFFIIPFLFKSLSVVFADKLYVSKNLKVHTEASLESPVNHLLLGGEQVEVLRIDGDFTEVHNKDDHIGWVASEFLSNVKPVNIGSKKLANLNVSKKELEKKNNKTSQKKINITKSDSTKQTSLQSNKQLEKLKVENQQLQVQLEKIREIVNVKTINAKDYNSVSQIISNISLWVMAGIGLLGFILGFLSNDYRTRKRHGGFEI